MQFQIKSSHKTLAISPGCKTATTTTDLNQFDGLEYVLILYSWQNFNNSSLPCLSSGVGPPILNIRGQNQEHEGKSK